MKISKIIGWIFRIPILLIFVIITPLFFIVGLALFLDIEYVWELYKDSMRFNF